MCSPAIIHSVMITNKIKNWWVSFMLWFEVVKILIKHAKVISKKFKQEKSATDDTPHVLTKDEISEVVLDSLIDAIPEITEIFHKRKRR